MDIHDIELMAQWWATCNMLTFWQRMGQGARDPALKAMVLLLIKAKHFDDEECRMMEAWLKQRRNVAQYLRLHS